jgi:hypothetical protein
MDEAVTGRICVGLDVNNPESLPDGHQLRSMPNGIASPRVAGPTRDHLPPFSPPPSSVSMPPSGAKIPRILYHRSRMPDLTLTRR